MSQTPRHIRTDRSLNRPDQAASAAPRRAAASGQGPVQGGAHSEPPRRPAQSQSEPPRRRKKKKKTPIWLPLAVVLAVIAVVSGVVVYAVSLVNRVEDSLRPDDSTPTIQEEIKTAEGYTLLAEPIEFTLTADGQCRRGDETFGKITPGADGVYNIALTVYNRKGFTLPHTGADAPSLWLLIGLPALVAVLLVLVFRYNKKGGKHS